MLFPSGNPVLSMHRSIFLACLALAACAAGGVADPFYVRVNPSLRTAYHSRARIIEDLRDELNSASLNAGVDKNTGAITFAEACDQLHAAIMEIEG